MAKKQKAVWGWAQAKKTDQPSEAEKAAITAKFEPLVQRLKQNLKPVPEPQEYNHCVDVLTKWRGNYFYLMQKYQCPPKGYLASGFEAGIARLEFRDTDSFDLAYFRHNGKWWVVVEAQTLEACLKAVERDPWFQVF